MQFVMLAPRKSRSPSQTAPSDAVTCRFGRTPDADYAIARLLRLEHFERFVFVMSVLEKYSDQDCSVLLGCSRQDVAGDKNASVAASRGARQVTNRDSVRARLQRS